MGEPRVVKMIHKGTKYDSKKLKWHLLPFRELIPVIEILMYGAQKYKPNNWKLVKPKERYFDACMRHLTAWINGEKLDKETGKPHISHAICCLLFLSWHERDEQCAG